MRIRWTERARRQLVEAVVYLEEQRPSTGAQFHEEVRRIIEIIRTHPLAYPRIPGVSGNEVRRALVERYRYWLIYEIDPAGKDIVILSTWHTQRRPLGWKD